MGCPPGLIGGPPIAFNPYPYYEPAPARRPAAAPARPAPIAQAAPAPLARAAAPTERREPLPAPRRPMIVVPPPEELGIVLEGGD